MAIKSRISIPWGFVVGLILIIVAWFVGGSSLAISAAWRWLLGLASGIGVMLIFGGVKKVRAKRK